MRKKEREELNVCKRRGKRKKKEKKKEEERFYNLKFRILKLIILLR